MYLPPRSHSSASRTPEQNPLNRRRRAPDVLFETGPRSDLGPALYGESHFAYLNRSGRSEFGRVRQILEEWLSRYPKDDRSEWIARFRSRRDEHFHSAFFELYLHEALVCLGTRVSVHPDLPASSGHPDFLFDEPSGQRSYLEATVVLSLSKEEQAAAARMNQVYDALNRKLDSPDFFLGLRIRGTPATPVPAGRLRSFLEAKLATVDPDECKALLEQGGAQKLPRWQFGWAGWQIEFVPIPKSKNRRGSPGLRPIGWEMPEFQYVDDRTPIRDAILKKATAYGDLNEAYVIAVNALGVSVDQTSILEALFGREQFVVRHGSDGRPLALEPHRAPDGVWTSASGPRFHRVSAALLVTGLMPWNVASKVPTLYHNPWAERPYSGCLTRLPQVVPQESTLTAREGIGSADLFGFPPAWPRC